MMTSRKSLGKQRNLKRDLSLRRVKIMNLEMNN